jgi:phage shock protein PspC (stress-responsive transcriptional regulator)
MGVYMTNISLANIRLRPNAPLTISGLSQGIAQAFGIAPGLVRFVWVLLYAVFSAVPYEIAAGVLADGPIGWVYLGWLLTGGSPVVNFYLFAWAFTPNVDGQRSSRPLRLWLVLFFTPLVIMFGIALLSP